MTITAVVHAILLVFIGEFLQCQALVTVNDLKNICNNHDIGNLTQHIDRISIPRVPGTQQHANVGQYISDVLSDAGFIVSSHEFRTRTHIGFTKFKNIIAKSDDNAEKYLTLACHYDSKDCASLPGLCSDPGVFALEGATDAAASCALLLHVAQTMQIDKNKRGIQFIFFDGEEAMVKWGSAQDQDGTPFFDGLFGSRALVQKWNTTSAPDGGTELDRVDALVLLDLIGDPTTAISDQPANDVRIFSQFPHLGVKVVHLIHLQPACFHRRCDVRRILDFSTLLDFAKTLAAFTHQYFDTEV